MGRILPVLLAGLAIPGDAVAQPVGSRLRVHLHPTDPDPITVTVRATDHLAPIRTTRVADGVASFSRLTPGAYEVRVILSVGRPVVGHLPIAPAEDVVMRVDTAGPSLSVISREPLALQTTLDADQLDALPATDAISSLIETATPYTFSDRILSGGVLTGRPLLVGSRGSSWTQSTFRIDGADVTDRLEGGAPIGYLATDTFGSMTVLSGLTPIEHDAPGPVVSLASRRPATALRGSVQVAGSPSGLQAEGPEKPPAIARLDTWADARVSVGGPLLGDRRGAFLSGAVTRARTLERAYPSPLASGVGSVFGHAVLLPTPRDEVRVIAAAQRVRRPFAGRARLVDRQTTEVATFVQGQLTWGRVLDGGTTWTAETAIASGRVRPDTDHATAGVLDRLYDGSIPERAFATRGTQRLWTASASVQPAVPPLAGRMHTPRLGVTLSRSNASRASLDLGPTAEVVNGLPARVWYYGYPGPDTDWRQTSLAAYAADRFEVADRLTIEAAGRFDLTDGSAAGAAQGIGWKSGSARVFSRWAPANRWTLFGGYRRYQYRLALEHLAFGDPAGPQGTVYRWRDPNGDGAFQATERGPLVAFVGPGSTDGRTGVDPELRQPHVDELIVGHEMPLPGSWTWRLVGTARRGRDHLASVNVGVPDTAYTVRLVPDPALDLGMPVDDQLLPIYNRTPASFGQDRYVLTNPDNLDSRYEGVELTIESPARPLWLLFGATASQSLVPSASRGFQVFEGDQGVVGEHLENPNARTHAFGNAFFDRGYTMTLVGSYRFPDDTRVGAVARYQDGQSFSRYVIAPDLNQGPEAIRAFFPGAGRFTYTFTLDLRIQKGWQRGGRRLVARLEAFNLLDTTHEVEEDIATGPAYRTPTAVQPPRAVRLTGRFEF